ncbi:MULTISPECIES: aKG-HExxH-type peptide beta-hydroxylase [unclassified Acinetobacter]|uniref:aKG-HExxH-type peptide beta-hydroxylase n=1 Tax=unclassified Acinetobacter TaxID=196816 RepID=UPI002934316E|nr:MULTISPECIES: HEXXH motif-containing putative peptide modification protein [unclassified Acinetobacter]WOE33306.1 HEXXH motif-containing putative peptide modification protein [Acinetobacter sp. SAAs470]WOE37035.1 HEXXH motif-containing putative peptide modification protein [Acinetobacter sp. SAAs474]
MLIQTSFQEQMENIICLVTRKYPDNIKKITNSSELKELYYSYLETLQKRKIEDNDDGLILTSFDKAFRISKDFNGGSGVLDDFDQKNNITLKPIENIEEKKEQLKEALTFLAEVHDEYYSLLNFMITNIFLFPSEVAAGGSSSTAVGTIWANLKEKLSTKDVAEFFIHELTHNCIFIDEHRYGHYDYHIISDESTWATSAVLLTNRPLDKVLHSIIVSMEIILFREKVIGHPQQPKIHPPTEILLNQIKQSINSIKTVGKKFPKALSQRSYDLLENVESNLKKIT